MQPPVQTPTLPELPAMAGSNLASSPQVMPSQSYDRSFYPHQSYQPGTPHLRRALGYFMGGGLVMALAVVVAQKTLPAEYTPAALISDYEAKVELGVMKGKLPVTADGKPIMTQGDYEREIARAKADGAGSVQFEYQKKLAVVEADQKRVIEAYSSLYQRANLIAEAGLQMEAALQGAKQQMVASSQGGRQVVSMWGDIGCALGMQGGCEAAQKARTDMVSDMDASRVDVGARIRDLMAGVPDPATLVSGADRAVNGTPTLPDMEPLPDAMPVEQ